MRDDAGPSDRNQIRIAADKRYRIAGEKPGPLSAPELATGGAILKYWLDLLPQQAKSIRIR
jgi:hypothetical protein